MEAVQPAEAPIRRPTSCPSGMVASGGWDGLDSNGHKKHSSWLSDGSVGFEELNGPDGSFARFLRM